MNKVMVVGNLGGDPELRFTPSGTAVCTFSVATTEHFKNKNSGEPQSETEWHSIVCWGKRGETANTYLKKGAKVLIEGRIKTRSWEDLDGNKRYKTEIIANHVEFLSKSPGKQMANTDIANEAAQAFERQANGTTEEEIDLPF